MSHCLAAIFCCGPLACGQVAASAANDASPAPDSSSPPDSHAPEVLPDTAADVASGVDGPPDAGAACSALIGSWTAAVATGKPLSDVIATARNDAWALPVDSGTIFHWDGLAWKESARKPGRNPYGVSRTIWASASNDVWVDDYTHWDGTSWGDWPAVDSAAGFSNYPTGLWGTGPNDTWMHVVTWASGGYFANALLHWDGAAWTQKAKWEGSTAPYHGPVVEHTLRGSGDKYLWATEVYDAYLWNGTALQRVGDPYFREIGAVWLGSERDVWLAGTAPFGLAHWDGASWTEYRLDWEPRGIAGTSTDLWVVGLRGTVSHWDGRTWCRATLPSPDDDLTAVTSVGPLDVWAVSDTGRIYHYGPVTP